jgi:predicted ester cyclase
MWLERRRAALRTIVEGAYNRGDLGALDELYSERLIYRRPPLADIEGLDGLRQYIGDIRCAFSDIEFTLDRIVSEGDAHAGLWTLRAIHTGQSPAMPAPPRGRRVVVSGSTLGVWAGMKIVEEWSHVDWLGLFRQLGVIPPMG